MLTLLTSLLMLLVRAPTLDSSFRLGASHSVRLIEKVQTLLEPRVILYRVDRIRIYTDAIEVDANVGTISKGTPFPSETELATQFGRLSILDRKGCRWQLGKDDRSEALVHFAPWAAQRKMIIPVGVEAAAEFRLDRAWELREFPTHFLPAHIPKGTALVFNQSHCHCHVLYGDGEPVRRRFATFVFGKPEVVYIAGESPRHLFVQVVSK